MIRKIIKRAIRASGYDVTRLTSSENSCITDPLEYNSHDNFNEIYHKADFVQKYIKPERLSFYRHVCDVIDQNDISLDRKTVVDVGCGSGHFLAEIKSRYSSAMITGYEFTSEAFLHAREICPSAEYVLQNIYETSSKQFDIVVCMEVLEHLEFPHRALRNLLNITNVGGYVIITVPDGRRDTFRGHINFWSQESFRTFISMTLREQKCRFEIVPNNGVNIALIGPVVHETSEHRHS